MKLFGTFDMHIISDDRYYFCFNEPSAMLERRRLKFIDKYSEDNNILCKCTADP